MGVFVQLQAVLAQMLALNDEPMLEPGLDRSSIEQSFASLDLKPPELLAQMYELHNGIFHLNSFLHFLPLSESFSTYSRYQEISKEGGLSGWRAGQFPVFDLNGDTQLCLDLITMQVVSVDIKDDSTGIVSADYESLVNAIVEVFQERAFFYDDVSGSIRFVPDQWQRIAAKHGVSPPW